MFDNSAFLKYVEQQHTLFQQQALTGREMLLEQMDAKKKQQVERAVTEYEYRQRLLEEAWITGSCLTNFIESEDEVFKKLRAFMGEKDCEGLSPEDVVRAKAVLFGKKELDELMEQMMVKMDALDEKQEHGSLERFYSDAVELLELSVKRLLLRRKLLFKTKY